MTKEAIKLCEDALSSIMAVHVLIPDATKKYFEIINMIKVLFPYF